jgi:O-antigen/teichoic acid export membrane protein
MKSLSIMEESLRDSYSSFTDQVTHKQYNRELTYQRRLGFFMKNRIIALLQARKDTLYMNSFFLMASTALVSGSGFFFWMIATHLYMDEQVGLATAIISVITFIMNVSILGLNYSIIHFLPKAKEKNQLLSTGFFSIAAAGAICATLFLLFLPLFSPKLVFLREHFFSAMLFLFFTIAVSLDFLTESIFLGLREGKYIFIKNILVSFLKLLLPAFFVVLGSVGIFIAWATALSSALVVSFFILFKKFKFAFTSPLKPGKLSNLVTFSSANYVVGLIGIAPGLIIPLLITNTINAQTSAYFYISFMIANLLYTIPYATTQSLFAEGSYDDTSLLMSIKKACKMIASLLIPGIIFLLLFSNYILLIFGKSYSTEGVQFLQLLALAGIPVSINYLGLTVVNLKRKMKALLMINIIGTGFILILCYLLREYALTGIGIAWLVGHLLKNILYIGYILHLQNLPSLRATIRSAAISLWTGLLRHSFSQ